MQQRPPVAGTKRRAESVRPDVATAVALCAQDALSERQHARLVTIARRLGVSALDNEDNLCATLAAALGDEWTQAAQEVDLFAAEEARAGARSRITTSTATATPLSMPTDWVLLPPEMRERVAYALSDADPRAALALYASGYEGAEAFAGQTHAVPILDEQGELVERRLPLIDYARLSAALGAAGPVQLFLAAATCTLKAYANWRITGPDASAFPTVTAAAPTKDERSLGPVNYATMLDAGVTSDQLDQMSVGALAAVARSAKDQPTLTLGQLRALLDGPVGPDPASIARQWYHFVTASSSDLLGSTTPLTVRSDVVLGGRALPPPRTTHLAHMDRMGIPLGVWTAAPNRADLERLRYALTVPYYVARQCLQRVAHADMVHLFDAWVRAPSDDVVAGAAEQLRDVLAEQEAPVACFLSLVEAAIGPLAPGSACAAVAARHPEVIPSFSRLFAGSRAWLMPLRNYGATLYVDLRSPVLDRVLAQQQNL
ncbi:hypothetical protein pclt_cds_57 [Pandoravirus celtis]|uniref:Uncharacterized protein n=1 Tax=Pandoravirus celtis TaxID=2568002 RepID=A0A4D6EFK6_9VIRU|nr:hypothetical protein pclt_cds_57 [Pandoravirus celtis]